MGNFPKKTDVDFFDVLYSSTNFMKLLEDKGIKTYRNMFNPKFALGSELTKVLKITKDLS